WTPRSDAYFASPLAQGTPGKQCGLAATGDYQPSLRSPWLAAVDITGFEFDEIDLFAYRVLQFLDLLRIGGRGPKPVLCIIRPGGSFGDFAILIFHLFGFDSPQLNNPIRLRWGGSFTRNHQMLITDLPQTPLA
ncbi:MAG: hypothetical protein JMN24_18500, partial [gamma proteobacterium endosymbiont of Lamellibrachia anaximandri]|nr:hypothetical protein [gamma proteobacterium endosymbiont of Lamellibrachia anaximandri]